LLPSHRLNWRIDFSQIDFCFGAWDFHHIATLRTFPLLASSFVFDFQLLPAGRTCKFDHAMPPESERFVAIIHGICRAASRNFWSFPPFEFRA